MIKATITTIMETMNSAFKPPVNNDKEITIDAIMYDNAIIL